jgi:hypothetical protein
MYKNETNKPLPLKKRRQHPLYPDYMSKRDVRDYDVRSGIFTTAFDPYYLTPATRNARQPVPKMQIERIQRPKPPQVNVDNLKRLYGKKYNDLGKLEKYYSLKVDYIPTKKRPTISELGKKAKTLYDLYGKVERASRSAGDVRRPARPARPARPDEPDRPEDPPSDADEGKYDNETYDDDEWETVFEAPKKPPVSTKDDTLFDKNDDATEWINQWKERMDKPDTDVGYDSDEWDEKHGVEVGNNGFDIFDAETFLEELEVSKPEQELVEDITDYKDITVVGHPLSLPSYDIPRVSIFEGQGEIMNAPERQTMFD